jgi:hypothetical protein
MGSGKTTIGTLLARQLAWRFVDLDHRIEETSGLTIPEIFERFGEPAFRQIEADQLRGAQGSHRICRRWWDVRTAGLPRVSPFCRHSRSLAGFTGRSTPFSLHDHDGPAALP